MVLLRQVRIAVILSSIVVTLLLLRNNQIPFHQSLNFVLFLLNYSGSRTMLLDITVYSLYTASASAINILSILSISVVSSEVFSSVILNDPSCSDNTSILFPQY